MNSLNSKIKSLDYIIANDIVKHSNDGYIVFDKELNILFKNYSSKKLLHNLGSKKELQSYLKQILEYDGSDLITFISNLIDDSKDKYIELNNLEMDKKHLNIKIRMGEDKTFQYFVMSILDNSEQYKDLERINYLSHYDTLTYLPKREYLKSSLDRNIFKEKVKNSVVLVIDLDRFKNINESYGYSAGDIVLRKFSQRINQLLMDKNNDFENFILGRSSGDEFILIIYNYGEFSDINTLVSDLLIETKRAYFIDEIRAHISCSIGVAFYPENGLDPEELFKNASLALFSAKKLGGDTYQIYEKSIFDENKGIHIMVEKIKDGMENNEIEIYYQPIIDLKEKKIASAEALSRWIDNKGKVISPDSFIPVLERTGLIKDFDIYVTRKVIKFIKENDNENLPPISINISATTYRDLKVIQEIEEIINDSNSSSKIRLEITETTAMSNVEYSKFVINELSKSGIKMLLDDFGSGYSSLKYLRDFSFDIVKIDKELVQNVDVDTSLYSVLKACVTMGYELGFEVLAEGVEKRSELYTLYELNFRYVQGYYYSRPLKVKDYLDYIKKFKYKL